MVPVSSLPDTSKATPAALSESSKRKGITLMMKNERFLIYLMANLEFNLITWNFPRITNNVK